jgi:hypothetical protein
LNICDGYTYGKHHHTLYLLSGGFMQKQFLNLCGPMATFHGKVKYFKTFINDFS